MQGFENLKMIEASPQQAITTSNGNLMILSRRHLIWMKSPSSSNKKRILSDEMIGTVKAERNKFVQKT